MGGGHPKRTLPALYSCQRVSLLVACKWPQEPLLVLKAFKNFVLVVL